MSFRRVIVSTKEAVEEAIASATTSESIFLQFCGAKDPITGISWCSDCIEAEPIINTSFNNISKTKEILLIYIPLVRSEFKGISSHWARQAPFNIQRIPTICKWGKTKIVASLIEDECKIAENVDTLLE